MPEFPVGPCSTGARFHLQTFGDLVLRDAHSGRRIGEPRRKPLAVLAFLSAEAHNGVNRDVLAALLWPELAPARARHALSQTIYALRKEVGCSELIVGGSELTLNGDTIAADVQICHARLQQGDFGVLIDLYAGPFLDGVCFRGCAEFEQWIERQRAVWEASHRNAMLQIAAADAAAGNVDAATGRLEHALARYPLDTQVATHLAELYSGSGEVGRALGVVTSFEARLQRDCSVALPAALAALCYKLTSGDETLVSRPPTERETQPALRHKLTSDEETLVSRPPTERETPRLDSFHMMLHHSTERERQRERQREKQSVDSFHMMIHHYLHRRALDDLNRRARDDRAR